MERSIPELAGSRASAADFIDSIGLDNSPVFYFPRDTLISQSFADELCKGLIARRTDSVTLVDVSEKFLKDFMRAYRLRSGKFQVHYRVGEEHSFY